MKIYTNNDHKYRVRNPVSKNRIRQEFLECAEALKEAVTSHGASILFDDSKLTYIFQHIGFMENDWLRVMKVIRPQLRQLCRFGRAVNQAVVVEQMYCRLLRRGYSRNIIRNFLYAVFYALDREFELSWFEATDLEGSDIFEYKKEREITVDNDNIESVEALVKQSDTNAMTELGTQILNGNIEKYNGNGTLARELCSAAANHGNGKAVRVLGTDSLTNAKYAGISNDYYSKAYAYYTAYGAVSNSNQVHRSQREIIDILNLGIYHKKMILNYALIALFYSFSFFVPHLLSAFGLPISLQGGLGGCIFFSVLEVLVVLLGIVVRRLKPFFTQSWIVFLQTIIWFIGFIVIIV